ncbi:uncharacterized protein [Physcomitrium patens]|uniref:Uncharacterized protein n=1 Tax=Physcomitrium patens TaxID=3218 RepID=A0A7I4BSP6_PHYPA|nr:uncharacterized protein LOC112278048 isoform X1 [Physcomitrium patens]XP_024366994.1 uncharacterized protein LOC112278048 isoform X1 [Physcomitrium patens]XP_024367079.1 uncharacterized protein LOC112278048 isoform X1 [Physcomitrium patens]XP_024367147.1 uncharacterized protein LOC112278048 isoform X1 [Physcomitrium patens]|eukprot:XP_024366866.1 uncharacterized protein LOC112278048 isoform X1 [Physcomitrella patens]
MLEATEDGSDSRLASSGREESPAATSKPNVDDRLVYKLVKVGDDGSVLPATEDEVFQSLVSGSGNGLSSFDADESGDGEDDEEDEEEDDERTEYDTDDEPDERARNIPFQDLAAQRQKLRARLQVLDSMLLQVDAAEQERMAAERDASENDLGHKDIFSPYFSAADGSGDKRQRRPNPKYFGFEAGEDGASGQPALSSSSGEPILTPTKEAAVSPRVTSGWGSHRSSVRSASTHRARSAVTQKPFTRTGTKVVSPVSLASGIRSAAHEEVSLENLSIRELHEAFRATYGRDTSVKDKHWLKRQISAGWMGQREAAFKPQPPVSSKLKIRLEEDDHAEQPLPSVGLTSVGAVERDAANEAKTGAESLKDSAWNSLEGKGSQHGMTTSAIVSTGGRFDVFNTGSLNSSDAARGQIALYGEVVNAGEPVGGKRQRKPNRRYIEDETEGSPGFIPTNDNRSLYGESGGNGMDSSANFTWRTVETDGPADMIGRHGTLRGPTIRNASNKNVSAAQRPKIVGGIAKRKLEGRASTLVKMADPARPTRQDTEGKVRKDGLSESNGGAGDRVSVLMPIVPFDPSAILQPLPLDSRPENDLPIATVPTANGGTRRKHHRPWTLREVMTLVEGVARCGGGKWADIKKLAFSNVGYRTAVDLKDKWRNLLRASRAQLHPAKQGERKKQFTAAIPAPILARVRELAALQNQISPTAGTGSSTIRSGRTVHRK